MARFDPLIDRMFKVISVTGDERIAKCPWHNDHGRPNLYINAVTGLYFCQRCGAKGKLDRTNEEQLPPKDLRDVQARLHTKPMVQRLYPESWLDQFDFDTDYWSNRGFSKRVIDQFRLGYDPVTDKVTIPVRDKRGRVHGVIMRALDDSKPKYTNPKGFKRGKVLFGSDLVREKHYHKIAVVEGPLDAVACWDANVPAVAMMGGYLTEDQAGLIKQLGIHTVVAMTDADKAGRDAVVSIKEALSGINLMVGIYLPAWRVRDPKDPADLTRNQRRAMFLGAVPWAKLVV